MPEASKKRPSSRISTSSSSRPSKMMKSCTAEDDNEGNSSDSGEDDESDAREGEMPVTGMDTSTGMNACVYLTSSGVSMQYMCKA